MQARGRAPARPRRRARSGTRAERDRERAQRDRERVQRDRERTESLYDSGQDALSDGQWTRAIERFARIVELQGGAGRRGDVLDRLRAEQARPAIRCAGDARRADQDLPVEPLDWRRPRAGHRGAAQRRPAGAARGAGRRGAEAAGHPGPAALRRRPGRADAREVPAGPAVAEAQGTGAVRARADQLAAGPPGAGRHRQGRRPSPICSAARSSTWASTPPRTTGRCWRRSTPAPPT